MSVRAIPWKARAVLAAGCLVVVLAAAAFSAARGNASSSAAPPVDHQLCYAASGAFTKVPAGVRLIDEFNPNGFAPKINGKAGLLCNPVAKTLPTGKVYGVTNPAAHLVCFPITATGTQPTPSVVVKNQFGSATLAPARQPNSVCVPSWKSLTGPLNKNPNTPPRLSHFTCYPVSVAAGAYNPPSGLKLQDEFGKTKVAVAVNPVPQELCVPAKKIVGSHTYPIVNTTAHLLCYGVSKTPIRNPVWAQNQFGRTKVAVKSTQWLCLPSTLDIPPAVISTTPSNGSTGAVKTLPIRIEFSEYVNAAAGAFTLECPTGTPRAFTVNSSPAVQFSLTPTSPLPAGTTCTVTVHASGITDIDAGSPLGANYTFSFTTCGGASCHVYFTTYGFGHDQGTVNSVQNSGGSVTTYAGGQDLTTSVAVDGAYVYWTNLVGSLSKVPIGGGNVTTLATGLNNAHSLEVDGASAYWLNEGDGTIDKVPIGGGSVTTLASGQSPTALAVDGSYVYFTSGTSVDKVPVGGGSVTTLATGQVAPRSIAVDGAYVYWVNQETSPYAGDGSVNKVPIGGGSVTTIVQGGNQAFTVPINQPLGMAVDGTNVYWTNPADTPNNASVYQVPIGGGVVTNLAQAASFPRSIAVDGAYVYWVDSDLAEVERVPIGGGIVTAITYTGVHDQPDSLALGP